jgi:hypothetical protein
MKKILVILLLLVYGAASSGMTLQFHYCCGKLDKVALALPKDTHCGMDHKMGSKPCCDTKALALKIKSEQQTSTTLQQVVSLPAIKPTLPDYYTATSVATKGLLPKVFAPPPLPQDFTRLYCSYRI